MRTLENVLRLVTRPQHFSGQALEAAETEWNLSSEPQEMR
jgi:hypothetical protein